MNLVKVYNAKDDLEANIIADILKNSGIPCHIQDVGSGEYLNIYYGFSVYGKDIFVDKSQFDEAKALIDEINTSKADDDLSTDFYNEPDYDIDDSEETNATIPWYYKKNMLVRGMFLIPIIIAIFFAILGIIEGM